MTHLRRTKGAIRPHVSFVASMHLESKKDHFRANNNNKQQFIDLLRQIMHEQGIKTVSADGYADLLIAKTGVKCSTSGITHVIDVDTGVLMLLCHYSNDNYKG